MAHSKGDLNLQSVGLNANIKIVDRPVTQHGMIGVSVKPQGGGRSIQDRSYFLNMLR
jgi:intraflagellar transport protein 74